MKAYQVFNGDVDKRGNQQWELIATYLSKDKALARCDNIVASKKLYDGDIIEFGKCGKFAAWYIRNREYTGICRFEEIEITE